MNYTEMMNWLRIEFPQCAWLESTVFGNRCIAAYIGTSRVLVRITKSGKFGVDLDKKGSPYSEACETIEQVRSAIIQCLKNISIELVEDVQMTLF